MKSDTKRLIHIEKFYDGLLDLFAAIACVMIVFVMFAVSLDVCLRFFFNAPIVGVTEITEYALLYICMFGAAWLLRANGHVSIDIVTGLFSQRTQKWIRVITSSVAALTCGWVTFWAALTTWDHFQRGIIDFKVLEIPKYTFLITIPFGFLLLMIEFIRKVKGELKKSKVDGGEEPLAF